ncbi:hypothetical protein MmiAt1_08460 [Methanimicrococcus sp. At1]|uniref:Methanogenesis marker protein 6 n=1 Tax=Methanimicrococcus hacksteinii TaxID=3028293 RepID=A0ABU3VPD4_9EURY|nr:methanogenesis marker 6 protein [Methanimicrococcus sp. At1]MDV0445278.1 hypothetical protein [Methanimicrococcus sp. At1]
MSSEIKDADKAAKPFVNKNVKKPLSGQKEITKIVAVSSDKVLPADAAQAAYASGYPVTLKETCYGLVLTGTEENVNAVVKIVQDLDKNHIFVKDRGFPAGDPRRCRATRNGGQRPGFYTLHEEISKMGAVGEALDNYEAGAERRPAEWPNRPSSFKMEDLIKDELGENKKKPKMAKVVTDRIAEKQKAEKAAAESAEAKTAKAVKTKATTETAKTKAAEKTAETSKMKTAKKAAPKDAEKENSKSAAKKSTAEKPTAKTSATKTSTAKAPAAKTPATKAPAAKTSATKTPTAKAPAAKTPATKTSTAKAPAARAPAAKTPTAKKPEEKKTAAKKK